MANDLEQLFNQMEQVTREFQRIQESWSELLKQIQQISREVQVHPLVGGYSGPMASRLELSPSGPVSYGAQYARQSERTDYGRTL